MSKRLFETAIVDKDRVLLRAGLEGPDLSVHINRYS